MGWRERVDLPEWGVGGLVAKLDTGARTSALHVEDIAVLPDGRLRFRVVVNRRSGNSVAVVAEVVRVARVRSSTGRVQRRFVVRTLLRVGAVVRSIELTLVSREAMRCRMLLGREALAGAVLVDSARTHVLGRARGRTHRERKIHPVPTIAAGSPPRRSPR